MITRSIPGCSTSILADGEQNGMFDGQNDGFSAFCQKFLIRATVHLIFPVVSKWNESHYKRSYFLLHYHWLVIIQDVPKKPKVLKMVYC